VPFDFIDRVYRVMGACPQHTFQVLTKRPERALEWQRRHEHQLAELGARPAGEPWPNVWLGVSIENRRFVHRAGVLRQIEVAVRFISAEPLLGPLIPTLDPYYSGLPRWADRPEQTEDPPPGLDLAGIDWLICGGESGPRARPLNLDWARDLRDACQAAGVAYFFKQVGGRTPKSGGRELDGRTWDEMPAAVAHA
jgi:protein gp37